MISIIVNLLKKMFDFTPRFDAKTAPFTVLVDINTEVFTSPTDEPPDAYRVQAVEYFRVEGLSNREVVNKLIDEFSYTLFNPLVKALRAAREDGDVWRYLSADRAFRRTVSMQKVWWLQVRASSSKFPSFLVWRHDNQHQELVFGPNLSDASKDREELTESLLKFAVPAWTAAVSGRRQFNYEADCVWCIKMVSLLGTECGDSMPWWTKVEAVMTRICSADDMKLIMMQDGVKPKDCETYLVSKYGTSLEFGSPKLVAQVMNGTRVLYNGVYTNTGHGTLTFPSLKTDDRRRELCLIDAICQAAMNGMQDDCRPISNKKNFDRLLVTAIEVEFNRLTSAQRAEKIRGVLCNVCQRYGHAPTSSNLIGCVFRDYVKKSGEISRGRYISSRCVSPHLANLIEERIKEAQFAAADEKNVYIVSRVTTVSKHRYRLYPGLIDQQSSTVRINLAGTEYSGIVLLRQGDWNLLVS